VVWSILKFIGEIYFPAAYESLMFWRSSDTPVLDLDWTATPDGQSILAIGFPHYILLIYQQRMTYFEQEPRWGVFGKFEIGR
jgi:hypothetical protein